MKRLILTSILAAAAAVACVPAPRPGTIDVLGDSVTVQADTYGGDLRGDVDLYAGLGWRADWAGGNATPQEHESANAASGRPERLVMALGLNDASPLWGGDGWTRADRDRVKALVMTPHPTACVVIVLPGYGPTIDPAFRTQLDRARASLAAIATERRAEATGHTVVIDWQGELDAHPTWVDEDGYHLRTPDTTPEQDLLAAAEGRVNPTDPEAAAGRLAFYEKGLDQC